MRQLAGFVFGTLIAANLVDCTTGPVSDPGNLIANTLGMRLAYIPAGRFDMGSPPEEKGRQPDEFQHAVLLTRPFRISATEVTQAQWQAVMGANRSHFKGDDLPVEKVSWRDAVAFCERLSELEGGTYRLPTEAEWEYACRATTTTRFSTITDELGTIAWYAANSDEHTHPVGSKRTNAWGLYDMHGNVSEWCSDYYEPQYPTVAVTDPTGPAEGKYHVMRGGSWGYFLRACRNAARSSALPAYQFIQTGFRVVMELPD